MFTTRCDCLPKVPAEYLCKKTTDLQSATTRYARFTQQPSVMTKKYTNPTTQKIHLQVHVTFQSTSLCNIQLVNMINKCAKFEVTKERGTGKNKCVW
eukprot:12936669-Ditylum_brightwellii.AAC.1